MKAQLTQEAKDALIEAIKKTITDYSFWDDWEDGRNSGREEAISIVESFPTSN